MKIKVAKKDVKKFKRIIEDFSLWMEENTPSGYPWELNLKNEK
jgi:predicted secreted protein